jgi:hypothetical protein
MKKLAGVLVAMFTLGLLLGVAIVPASAQEYPPGDPVCGVSDTTLGPGDQVTVSGDNWKPGSTVHFTLQPEGIDLGSATVDAGGSFSTVVTIPDSVEAGSHSITCSGIDVEGNAVSRNNTIQVLGGVVGGGDTAFTGSTMNVPAWMALIAALLVSGLLLVALGRRRRGGVGTGS